MEASPLVLVRLLGRFATYFPAHFFFLVLFDGLLPQVCLRSGLGSMVYFVALKAPLRGIFFMHMIINLMFVPPSNVRFIGPGHMHRSDSLLATSKPA